MLSFKATKEDLQLISEITRRAMVIIHDHDLRVRGIDINMDINACHSNGCPLQLAELLAAPDSDFTHDVFGIHRHINRETGQLEDCFLPRYAQR